MDIMIVDILVCMMVLLVIVICLLYIRDLKKIENQQREIIRLRHELEKRNKITDG